MRKSVPSPATLDKRLTILEDRWRIFVAAGKYFLLPMIVAVVAGIVIWLLTTILPARNAFYTRPKEACPKNMPYHPTMPFVTPSPAVSPSLQQATQTPPLPTETAAPPSGIKIPSVSPEPSVNIRRSKRTHP